ncbi:MAG: prolyl oligopeptidase family serine peptidase [Deltaproteobacteria bacterium]|nr:prolyl oligopeptidase family serine peptidase [Deltaproteobacteria bacterium]
MLKRVCQTTVVVLVLLAGTAGALEIEQPLRERIDKLSSEPQEGLAKKISFGTIATLRSYIFGLERYMKTEPEYAMRMTAQVESILDSAEKGEDLVAKKRGFFWRGYRSRFTNRPQMYSIYVPPGYDPKKPMPLVVSLHGGSSNHNVWLALNLGNKISVADYWNNFRTHYEPVNEPESAIVVAPDGLGQIRWRWMGEQDIFDVIDDVQRNYTIDADKVFLTGLSNGGIGAYTAGLKHAWRFAAVFPLSGVTDWPQHNASPVVLRPSEKTILDNESAITYAENAFNTHLRFYHGVRDSGFKVEQARRLAEKLERLKAPFRYHEFKELGHDLSHVMWRKMLIMRFVKTYTRRDNPTEVRLVTATERAGRQFWVVLDDRIDHRGRARIRAWTTQRTAIDVETENTRRLTLLLDQCPVFSPIQVTVDGQVAYEGRIPPSNRLTLERIELERRTPAEPIELDAGSNATDAGAEVVDDDNFTWRHWNSLAPPPGTRKVARLAGPLGDANYEEQVHVFGTLVKEDTPLLRKAARLGARGWMIARQYTEVRHPVIADTDLTEEMMERRVVVLYGNARNNSILAEIGDKLPIEVGKKHIGLRQHKLTSWGTGARFICPNPLAPHRYLVVQAGVSAEAVEQGGQLPIYLGDYIVYNTQTTKKKAFMILGRRQEVETGFFTEDWRLPDRPPRR